MEVWDVIRWIHLVAMAFFVGGQIMLAAVVVPVLRGDHRMRAVARNFGIGTAVAIGIAVLTGLMMASQFNQWQDGNLHAKLGLLVVVAILLGLHTRRPGSPALSAGILVSSLAIVAFAVALAH